MEKNIRFVNEIPDENIEKNNESFNEKMKDDFDFNQDLEEDTNNLDVNDGYRSPGYARYKKNKILKWKK